MKIIGPVYHKRLRKVLRHVVRCKQNDFSQSIVLIWQSLGYMAIGKQAMGFYALGKAQALACKRCAKRKKRKNTNKKRNKQARRLGLIAR